MPRSAISMSRQIVRDFGTCLKFTSTSTSTLAPATVLNQLNSGYTMSIWVKRLGFGVRNPFIKGSNLNDKMWFNFEAGNTIRVYHSGLTPSANITTVTVKDFNWHHLCATYNGTTLTIYLDGVSVYSQAVTGSIGWTASETLFVGGPDGSNANAFAGNHLVDEALFYSRAWTATEVANYFYGISTPTSNQVLYYKMDEGSGTSLTDSSGNGNTGTITGAPYSTDVFLKPRTVGNNILGSALSFRGGTATDNAAITSVAAQNGLTTVSYSYWVYVRSTPGTSYTHFQKGNSDAAPYFKGNSNGADLLVISAAWSGGEATWTVPALSKNAWHHIAITDDGVAGHTPTVYVDNVSQVVTVVAASSGTRSADQAILKIGNRNDNTRALDGIVDEFRMYNRVLSSAEVATLFGMGSVTSGLVGYWPFDYPTDPYTAPDLSASATNMVVSGAAFVTGNVNLNPGLNSFPRNVSGSRTVAV